MTPLYATVNAQWAPQVALPAAAGGAVPAERRTLEVMEALLKKGANPNTRIVQQPWYFALQQLRQRQLRPREPRGHDGVLARGVRVDVDAMSSW